MIKDKNNMEICNVWALILNKAKVNEVIGGNKLKSNLSKSKNTKLTKSKNLAQSKNYTNIRTKILIPKTKLVFTLLKQTFIKVLSLQYFDLK